MRWSGWSALLAVALGAVAPAAHGEGLLHDWRSEEGEGKVRYLSNHTAPSPYSETNEPEATLTMQVVKAPRDKTLRQILDAEIADIADAGKGLRIAAYQEQDGHQPDHGVASYIEDIDGQNVGFIKYRVGGIEKVELAAPRSVIHALMVKDGRLWYVTLIVVYPKHQDEVRADQIRLVRAIIRH